jgi:hypothetical protein
MPKTRTVKRLKYKNPCHRIGSCHDRLCIFCRRCVGVISPSHGGLLNSMAGGAKSQAGSQAPNPVIRRDIHSIFLMHVPASPIVYGSAFVPSWRETSEVQTGCMKSCDGPSSHGSHWPGPKKANIQDAHQCHRRLLYHFNTHLLL